MRPFDVQVLAAIALDCGHLVEMQTGEGRRSLPSCRARFALFQVRACMS
jgi:preprotein translocase subunit SecA